LFYVEIPARNENALLLALGFVMGWAGAVIASEYGATSTGRKVAESAVRNIERQNQAAEAQGEKPAGTEEDPLKTEVVNSKESPVAVTETKPKGGKDV
jgi:hypothetical protein